MRRLRRRPLLKGCKKKLKKETKESEEKGWRRNEKKKRVRLKTEMKEQKLREEKE